ncbi:unnamed protein product [Clonostachys chloroleuca]|uniref:B30.2/SPRY domain-containing protein n=1 Tax=Clonostachys chloroleuca TaxID=1926264 RepID=A0AA35QAG7_9HYPO|nr:unnamed protein product [Clonostachys chloroleuca]
MTTGSESPKREPTPTTSLSSVPQKRLLDEGHSPAVPSPLNPDVNPTESHLTDDAPPSSRAKSVRAKKDTLKKREAKGGDGDRATPDPKRPKEQKHAEGGPLRYKLAPPKTSDFEAPRPRVLAYHHEVETSNGETIQFFETADHVFNKKNFRYTHCIADPLFPSTVYYRQTEVEPFGPRMSYEDAAGHVFFDKSARHVTTDKGFRMARGNVAVREGRSYWECKITQGIRKTNGDGSKPDGGRHVRMGWARREASLDAPVGFDAYSYGIRDVAGEKVFMSRPKPFFPPGETIQEGDVIGLEIRLPSERLHRKVMAGTYNPAIDLIEEAQDMPITAEAANIVRDRVPIRFKAHTYFEKIEYHSTKELEDLMNPSPVGSGSSTSEPPNPLHRTPALRTLPNSSIKIYKNGVLMGTPFEDLLGFLPPASKPLMPQVGAREGFDDGMLGYYPAISIFRGGAAEVNFGPDFWYPPPDYPPPSTENAVAAAPTPTRVETMHAVSERYRDQIAEDVVFDIIDEVDVWMQDILDSPDSSSDDERNYKTKRGRGTEIKELVQED